MPGVLGQISVVLHPEDLGTPSKTGLVDSSVALDLPEHQWIGRALLCLKARRAPLQRSLQIVGLCRDPERSAHGRVATVPHEQAGQRLGRLAGQHEGRVGEQALHEPGRVRRTDRGKQLRATTSSLARGGRVQRAARFCTLRAAAGQAAAAHQASGVCQPGVSRGWASRSSSSRSVASTWPT